MNFNAEQRGSLAWHLGTDQIDRIVAWVLAAGFDPRSYLDSQPDLKTAGFDAAAALHHFLFHGFLEQRTIKASCLPAGLDIYPADALTGTPYQEALLARLYSAQLMATVRSDYFWGDGAGRILDFLEANGAEPFYVIGDSHTQNYSQAFLRNGVLCAPVVLLCSGGSAIGLPNDDSRSGYGRKILAWAEQLSHRDRQRPLFLKFGQVDAEFVWSYERIRNGQSRFDAAEFDDFARRSVSRFFDFVERLSAIVGADSLRICTIFPPTLSDDASATGYVNDNINFLEGDRPLEALKNASGIIDIPDLSTRTSLHARYNRCLYKFCAERNLRFVDDFHAFLAPTGMVDPRYTAFGKGRDHHLDIAPAQAVTTGVVAANL